MRNMRWYTILLCTFTQVTPIWQVRASLISKWSPTRVTLESVSQSYPESFWRKMTSSVPRRKCALDNVSLVFDAESVTLLVGESSAGKSTILRLITGNERPTLGQVKISNLGTTLTVARPISLDSRPSYRQNEVVEAIWTKAIPPISTIADSSSNAMEYLRDLSDVLKLPLQSKIMDLSMSEVYLCRLGEACLESTTDHANSSNGKSIVSMPTIMDEDTLAPQLPAPILLLDEWLDNETSTVVQRVLASLEDLADFGAVVVCVTHKLHLFGNGKFRRITLSRGKVLPLTQ